MNDYPYIGPPKGGPELLTPEQEAEALRACRERLKREREVEFMRRRPRPGYSDYGRGPRY